MPSMDFNPRPPCGGRPGGDDFSGLIGCISIHVLRVEDDPQFETFQLDTSYFNPRPPCGGRQPTAQNDFLQMHFNPRPPCGGRPFDSGYNPQPWLFQSTSSVWRTTLWILLKLLFPKISIHVLRVEDDPQTLVPLSAAEVFQSTSSVWRTTGYKVPVKKRY